MHDPLLLTKLRPPPRAASRARARLLARLDTGATRRLTLVSAPAGYGKTSALAAWVAHTPLDAAWLGLDAGDRRPTRFLRHLVASLQQRDDTLRELGDFVGDDLEAALITVVNDVASNREPLVLVLDDLHLVDEPRVHELLDFLLLHAPAQLRLMIGTRLDPPLPLARLRVAGELTEVRADDLRLTVPEARALLDGLGVTLEEGVLEELVARTEGWAAGVQLAALSLRGRSDPAAFVRYFTGTDRFVLDYLTEEVLMRQPTEVQDFLLLTSVLDELDAGLARAVTKAAGAGAELERVERANLFLAPLGGRSGGYRYHPFFQELLLHRLRGARPDLVPVLHARAAAELQRRGNVEDAARHAWRGGDPALAARLLEGHPSAATVRRTVQQILGASGADDDLATMLAALHRRGLGRDERRRVLEALDGDDGPDPGNDAAGGPGDDPARATREAGLEPLTERELEVVRLIAAGLPNKRIARRLGITLNTVKSHAKNAYAKLDVGSRTAAAARARELGLV